jgi:hypothetical protein
VDTVLNLLRILAIAFLAFLGGAFVVLTKVFPYDYLDEAHEALVAVYKQQTEYKSPYQTNLWRKARTDARGVTINKRGKTYAGYTLYTSGHAQKAFLISMDGTMVHEWGIPIRQIWEDKTREPRPDGYVVWEYAYMYPNGDLLAIIVGMGDTPWGYALVKMDKDSNVIWKYFDHFHHHLDVADDGRIYVLANKIRNNVIKGYEHLRPPRIDDYVVVLSPDGKLLKKVSILDALLRGPYGRMMRAGPAWNIKADFLHTNSVEVITPTEASKLPFAKPGQVLLSLRDIDTIAVLDLDKEEVVWALEGPWHRQHDADMLPNGHVLLFDNWGHYPPGGGSEVVEFVPEPLDMLWSYSGDKQHFFESGIRSGQQRLPNGNTLIIESDGGRLIEVTRKGEVVWEYINPVRGGKGNNLIPVILLAAQRAIPQSLTPEFLRDLESAGSRTTAAGADRE